MQGPHQIDQCYVVCAVLAAAPAAELAVVADVAAIDVVGGYRSGHWRPP